MVEANKESTRQRNRILPSADAIRTVGGLIAVGVGVAAVVIIAVIALKKNSQISATIAGSAAGVIASIVGAFFGVKIGTDQTKDAIDAARDESGKKDKQAAKAQVYALHVPGGVAAEVESAAAAAAAATVDEGRDAA